MADQDPDREPSERDDHDRAQPQEPGKDGDGAKGEQTTPHFLQQRSFRRYAHGVIPGRNKSPSSGQTNGGHSWPAP